MPGGEGHQELFQVLPTIMGLKTFSKRNSWDYPQTQLIRYTYRNVKAKTTTETTLGLYQNDIQLRDI